MTQFGAAASRGVALAAIAWALMATGASAASCIGKCGTLGANGDVTAPPGGGTYGWVSTFGGVTGAGQLPTIGGTNGSQFTTSAFTATAGQNLHYEFNFITSDGQFDPGGFIYEDYGSVQLIDVTTGNSIMLFNARTEPSGTIAPGTGLPPIDPGVTLTPLDVPISPGSGTGTNNFPGGPVWSPLGSSSGTCYGAGCGLTGWIASDYTVATSGTYQLVFGVSNWSDTAFDTGLAYNGITIGTTPIGEDVPEPAAWALMLVGFGGLGATLRRRRAVLAG